MNTLTPPGLPDLSLPATLRRLGLLVRSWPGTDLGADGLLRGLNLAGTAIPVLWCFNAQDEFAALGAAMGPDKPLVGMRSLNQIVPTDVATRPLLDALALHYATAIVARFGRAPCIVGGNCQAGGIAWRLAMQLWLAGVPVLRLVTLDAELRVPFPGHVRHVFGAESRAHNPFLTPPEDPDRPIPWHWRRAFGGCDWHFLPAGHGQYFTDPALPALVAAIQAPHEPPAPPLPMAKLDWRVAADTPSGLRLTAVPHGDTPVAEDLALMPVWLAVNGALLWGSGADWVVPVHRADPTEPPLLSAHVARPPADAARLIPVLCATGRGPLDWP